MFTMNILCFSIYNCEPHIQSYQYISQNYDVIQIHVIIRHGARTPLHIDKHMKDRLWKCSNTELTSYKNEKNYGSLSIHNKFDRSLIGRGNCIFGQLLNKGVKQLNSVGKYLREVYIENYKFLPTQYDSKYLKIRSTGSLRTIHTAMSVMNGLYIDNNDVNIFMAEKKIDHWKRTSLVCPKFMELMRESFDPNKAGYDFNFSKKLEEELGIKLDSANDIVTSTLCQGFKLPDPLTEVDADAIISTKMKIQQSLYNNETIYPLFFSFQAAEILNDCIDRINGRSNLRFALWSAHDGNINSFFGYLGIFHDKWPPYGSFFNIELIKDRETCKYYLRILYNGKTVQSPRFSNQILIPFEDFKDFVISQMPTREQCGFDMEKLFRGTMYPSPHY